MQGEREGGFWIDIVEERFGVFRVVVVDVNRRKEKWWDQDRRGQAVRSFGEVRAVLGKYCGVFPGEKGGRGYVAQQYRGSF